MAHLDLAVPDEPDTDYFIRAVLGTFYLANRGRSYISGMAVMPLPISVRDITDVLAAHPIYIDRNTLDPCIFAIDDAYISSLNKDAKQADSD